MKRFNILFTTLLLACLALSFIAPNNLDKKQTATIAQTSCEVLEPQTLNMDTISREELQKFVSEKLIEPLTNCMEKADPHLFMTKCYSKLEFKLAQKHDWQPLYKETPIKGHLTFIDCSREIEMGNITIDYTKKEIKVKESFKSPTQDAKTYLNDMCKFISKNGVPKE